MPLIISNHLALSAGLLTTLNTIVHLYCQATDNTNSYQYEFASKQHRWYARTTQPPAWCPRHCLCNRYATGPHPLRRNGFGLARAPIGHGFGHRHPPGARDFHGPGPHWGVLGRRIRRTGLHKFLSKSTGHAYKPREGPSEEPEVQ
jgi:hypothetical protein